jgi:hypothetical protein
METVINKTFQNQPIVVDDKNFVKCIFRECDIVYAGGDFSWVNTTFENCKVTITGNAAKTVAFMQQIGMLPPQSPQLPVPEIPDSGVTH